MRMMPLALYAAKEDFLKNHQEPKVITLGEDTKVMNKGNTSNRHPSGNFENSWMKYWVAFSGVKKDFTCSIDGQPIWIEDDKESCDKCKKENRAFEIMYHPDKQKSDEVYKKREAHGAHVSYKGGTYIVPMSVSNNTSLGDKQVKVTLKAGTVLVEEVDPRIDEEE